MGGRKTTSAVSLLFTAGERPDASAVEDLSRAGSGFSVSHDPGEGGVGEAPRWLELLSNGLTFDIEGLAGGPSASLPVPGHRFGLPDDLDSTRLRAIALRPGKHLAAGETMPPVLRTLAYLAAELAALRGVRAVAWHPARCWSHPQQFRDGVLSWMQGGVFPAFCLAALAPTPDGGMQSEGLSLFTGQELRIEPELASDRVEAGKLAVRLLHWLYEHGRVVAPERVTVPDGPSVRLEPSPNLRFIRAWRG